MGLILFVCTGNTCRSPMAEGIFNKAVSDKGTATVFAESAGIFANPGQPASSNAVLALGEIGIDIAAHRARRVDVPLLERAESVFVMTPEHGEILRDRFDKFAGKIKLLGRGVPDPFGGGMEEYRRCRDIIAFYTGEILKKVK